MLDTAGAGTEGNPGKEIGLSLPVILDLRCQDSDRTQTRGSKCTGLAALLERLDAMVHRSSHNSHPSSLLHLFVICPRLFSWRQPVLVQQHSRLSSGTCRQPRGTQARESSSAFEWYPDPS